MSKNQTKEILIERLSYSGDAVGRIDGKVCFVPYTLPDELIVAEIKIAKKSYSKAVLKNISKSSPHRITPKCRYFGKCGGCQWQHIDYKTQLEQKLAIFKDILWRFGKIEANKISSIIASEKTFSYRQRARFKLFSSNSHLSIGFYQNSTHLVEDIADGCQIVDPKINLALKEVREVLNGSRFVNIIVEIVMETDDDNLVVLFDMKKVDVDFEKFVFDSKDNFKSVTGCFVRYKNDYKMKVFGDDRLRYKQPLHQSETTFINLEYIAGNFSQVNLSVNNQIMKIMYEMLSVSKKETILDLYCGNGNFSIPFARFCKSVTGIEINSRSIEAAKSNVSANNIENANYKTADVMRFVEESAQNNDRYDYIILDPPRSGVGEILVSNISKLSPKRIVYISCDPTTAARDFAFFAKSGYMVDCSVAADMFPQTYHIESVTLIKREEF